jgi:hypothetical protein
MSIQYNKIPELAGVATYRDAARIGYSVEENVTRLTRLHWTERRLMHILLSHIQGISQSEAMDRAQEIHERTWSELDNYKSRDPQTDWWPEFVREVLGKESAGLPADLAEPKILASSCVTALAGRTR